MAPLIPQNIINGDLNFLFAIIIGIAFGFILEQAGFSSSRKLAGVFYGYDFVVLKVFFTAGITAATGVFFFQYLGWIDINMVYVNPLFTLPAIIGGVIMGFGFIMGGFCPGTGFTAAVIGKIDAMVFIVGIFIGIFIFGYFFDFFEPIYNSNPQGRVFIFDSLGISQNWFLAFLITIAVIAFAVTQNIQDKSSKFKELLNHNKLDIKYPLTFILALAIVAVFLPQNRKTYAAELPKSQLQEKVLDQNKAVSPIKVAHTIVNNLDDIYLIDVRSTDQYNHFHLPGAINIPFESILDKKYKDLLHRENSKTVLYSNGGTKAAEAWFTLSRAGLGDFNYLDGGLNFFFDIYFGDLSEVSDKIILDNSNKKFIERTRKYFKDGKIFNELQKNSEIPSFDKNEIKPAAGGC